MKKINSKQKGKRGELEWCKFCKKYGINIRRSQQYCGSSKDSADCVGLDGIHFEVKRVEKLNIDKAMEQAINDCGFSKAIPVVVHKKNRGKWLVTMRAEDWIETVAFDGYK